MTTKSFQTASGFSVWCALIGTLCLLMAPVLTLFAIWAPDWRMGATALVSLVVGGALWAAAVVFA